jgi:glycosyltransferase involved in cell wall biosynthesis
MNASLNKEISVIVPFYNEERFIEQSILRLIDTKLFKKIILVNDKSSDKSGQIAEKISKQFDFIQLINLDNQKGKGNAIRVGLEYVRTSHLIVHDADLEYFPSDIPEMFEAAKTKPSCLVLGSRTIGKKNRNNKYMITYYGNKILTHFFSLINFYAVSDIASCYWLIETEVLKKLDIKEDGFAIEVEVLSKFLLRGNKIFEVPINYDGRLYSEGKKIKLKDGIFIFIKIIKYSKLFNFFKFRKHTY